MHPVSISGLAVESFLCSTAASETLGGREQGGTFPTKVTRASARARARASARDWSLLGWMSGPTWASDIGRHCRTKDSKHICRSPCSIFPDIAAPAISEFDASEISELALEVGGLVAPTLESLPAPVGLQTQMASESGKAPPRCPAAAAGAGVAAALLLAAAAAGGQITQQQQSPVAMVMQSQQESATKALGGPAVLPTYLSPGMQSTDPSRDDFQPPPPPGPPPQIMGPASLSTTALAALQPGPLQPPRPPPSAAPSSSTCLFTPRESGQATSTVAEFVNETDAASASSTSGSGLFGFEKVPPEDSQ